MVKTMGKWFCICFAVLLAVSAATAVDRVIDCDVVIAGGSTASLAAAITAAEADQTKIVCFTEITDWPGGQMTAGGVPAIDFGGLNQFYDNQPSSFRDAMEFIAQGAIDGNPGACSVSTRCYRPDVFVEGWVFPRLAKSPNLKVFLRTVVVDTTRDANTGRVTSIRAVQRTPRNASEEWTKNLSEELPDWYSETDSDMFSKEVLQLNGKIFVEATELADVLVTADLRWSQGIESPNETDFTTQSTCGQAWTLTFYLEQLASPPENPTPIPPGSDEGGGWPDPTKFDWYHSWSWRRSYCAGNRSLNAVNVGDITQQNLGNDLDTAYIFLDEVAVRNEHPWQGGVNLTALKMMEQRAYGWANYMIKNVPDPSWSKTIILSSKTSGTKHLLSKFPYARDTRRAIGIDDYRLFYAPLDYFNASQPDIAEIFPDRVALDDYNMDVHHLSTCTYPEYIYTHTTKPATIPLRALLVQDAPNLLVAGKTMSQTFHANGATRLHPSEYTSGVAAGGAAILMLQKGWDSTAQLLEYNQTLQAFLNSSVIGQPLLWSDVAPPAPPQIGFVCALGRCFGVDKAEPGYPVSSSCNGTCPPLGTDEWLANMAFWSDSGSNIIATQDTILKKATTNSHNLPPNETLAVQQGTACKLLSTSLYPEGYKLCSIPSK